MMFGGGTHTSFAWIWLVGALAMIGLIAGIVLLVRNRGGARSGALLALGSLALMVGLAGMTLTGTWPRPGSSSMNPGAAGFVTGTVASPRIVQIVAGPSLRFYPDVVPVVMGETITFEVTTMGYTAHEFMVGPAVDVAADAAGTPEVGDIGMMGTKSVTYTFDGPGPFTFACHAPGHYEAGMKGTIRIQP